MLANIFYNGATRDNISSCMDNSNKGPDNVDDLFVKVNFLVLLLRFAPLLLNSDDLNNDIFSIFLFSQSKTYLCIVLLLFSM